MELAGQILKRNREIKNLTLRDISYELNISESILNDIENSYLSEDIDLVFIIGHLRSYCNYLDLNHFEIVNQFKIENLPKQSNSFEIERPKIENFFSYTNKTISLSLIVIIFSSFYLLFIDNDKSSRDYAIIPDLPENYISIVEKANLDSAKEINILKVEKKLNSSSAIASSPQKLNQDIAIITLKILDPTWVQLRDKNNVIILSQLMNKNEEYSYNSDLSYSVTSGNAGHILVLINQKVRGKIGKTGEVVDSLVLDKNFNN